MDWSEEARGGAIIASPAGKIDESTAQAFGASLEGAVEHREALSLVGADLVHEGLVVGLAEGHRAQAERRDLGAGRPELSVFHPRDATRACDSPPARLRAR